ncbi:MAG: hypothetical protein ACOYIN_02250 [Christensenellales bacterium]|jgi:D-alanine-D-alanine ligase|nr:hypothetical protein [Clostridia bacterium]HRU84387.1 hypothetical protein [Eubacteriales bacterium]
MERMKLAVIFGGRSPESDISILTALEAISNLDAAKYEIIPVYISKNGAYTGNFKKLDCFTPFEAAKYSRAAIFEGAIFIKKKDKWQFYRKPAAALLCTHGGEGENGVLQAVLEASDIPYTSAGVLASAIGMDKIVQKQLFSEMLLNVVDYIALKSAEVRRNAAKEAEYVENYFDYPVIVKPACQGSSIGIAVAKGRAAFVSALMTAACYGENIIVERALTDFLEINCAALKKKGEIIVSETEQPVNWQSFLSFEDKYIGGKYRAGAEAHRIPAPVDDALNKRIKELVVKIYKGMGLAGVVRMDFFFDRIEEKLYINEINTIPGALAHYLFRPLSITYPELLDALIAEAVADAVARSKYTLEYKSGVLSHFVKAAPKFRK